MGTIAIVANPNSGKDIRRLVTHATVIDNTEKVNILRRIIAGVTALGRHDIWMMPDRYRLARRALDGLRNPGAEACVHLLPMPVTDTQDDTTDFVRTMVEKRRADAVIVLGGDGTSRAAAKAVGDVPLIAVSTGTNNVYPAMLEGTAVAMAAAAVAAGVVRREECGPRGKRIEIAVGDRRRDIALIDAVFTRLAYTGARALLHCEEIEALLASQCHPASIGFSALAGSVQVVRPHEAHGLYVEPDWTQSSHLAAISAGVMTGFGVRQARAVPIGEPLCRTMGYSGTVAVDGERELTFREGETVRLTLSRQGPRKVEVAPVVELAAARGLLRPEQRPEM